MPMPNLETQRQSRPLRQSFAEAAGDDGQGDDAVAGVPAAEVGADLHHLAAELVAQDRAGTGAEGQGELEGVWVGAADAAVGDAEEDLAGLQVEGDLLHGEGLVLPDDDGANGGPFVPAGATASRSLPGG